MNRIVARFAADKARRYNMLVVGSMYENGETEHPVVIL